MERFIVTDTASVELFFNILTFGIETSVIPWDQLLYPCVVEGCRLGLNHLTVWHSYLPLCHSEKRWQDRNFLSCKRRWTTILSMLTTCALLCVLVSVALALTCCTIFSTGAPVILCNKELEITAGTAEDEFRSALCSVDSKLYHRPHFIVDGSWNKSLHLQLLQRFFCGNSGSPASACVMRRHNSIMYIQSLQAINVLL